MYTKNEIDEKFDEINLEELKKVFEKDKNNIDLNDKKNIFINCKISEQEAINGCTKKIKYKQIIENGKEEQNVMDVKIPKEIKNNSLIVCYGQGNYIKEQNKISNLIIKIEIK